MQHFLYKAKALFFEENFSKAYERQKDKLLKFFNEETAKQKISIELERDWNFIQKTLKAEVELFFSECERRLTSDELEQLKKELQSVQEKTTDEDDLQVSLVSVKWSNFF